MEFNKPLIGAIVGPAVAGGMELVLWYDIRIMAEDAYFGITIAIWEYLCLIEAQFVFLDLLVSEKH